MDVQKVENNPSVITGQNPERIAQVLPVLSALDEVCEVARMEDFVSELSPQMIQAVRMVQRGFKDYSEGRYEDAVLLFEAAIELEPAVLALGNGIYEELAESYYHIGEYARGAFYLSKVSAVNSSEIKPVLATLLIDESAAYERLKTLKTFDDRIAALLMKALKKEVIFTTPNPPQYFLTQVQEQFRRGNYQEAIEKASSLGLSNYRATSYALKGDLDGAIREYSHLISSSTQHYHLEDYYIERGLVHLLRGDLTAALTDLKAAEYSERAYFYSRGGNGVLFHPNSTYIIEWVKQVYHEEMETIPEPMRSSILAEEHLLRCEYDRVIALLEPISHSRGEFQNESALLDMLGRAYLGLGKIPEAAVCFAQLSNPSPLREVCRLMDPSYETIEIAGEEVLLLAFLLKILNKEDLCVKDEDLYGVEKAFFTNNTDELDKIKGKLFIDQEFPRSPRSSDKMVALRNWIRLLDIFLSVMDNPFDQSVVHRLSPEERVLFGIFMEDRFGASDILTEQVEKGWALFSRWEPVPLALFVSHLLQPIQYR